MEIVYRSIGIIYTPYREKAPYQPVENESGEFKIVIDKKYAEGLKNLAEFEYIYVIFHMHRAVKFKRPLVSPPWTKDRAVGVFASRSPERPNPIGLSIVKIKAVTDRTIYTSCMDVLNGTPLLDIKPYIKELDSKYDANYGWLNNIKDFEHLILHIKGIPHNY